jgi:hypothetical protein
MGGNWSACPKIAYCIERADRRLDNEQLIQKQLPRNMTQAALMEIIAKGENSEVEFKREDVTGEDLAEEVVAFANLTGASGNTAYPSYSSKRQRITSRWSLLNLPQRS